MSTAEVAPTPTPTVAPTPPAPLLRQGAIRDIDIKEGGALAFSELKGGSQEKEQNQHDELPVGGRRRRQNSKKKSQHKKKHGGSKKHQNKSKKRQNKNKRQRGGK